MLNFLLIYDLNMNTGHTLLQLLQRLVNEKQIVVKHWTRIQLYAVTSFHGSLTTNVNDKNGQYSKFSSWFGKSLLRSDVELPIQAERDRKKHVRYYM